MFIEMECKNLCGKLDCITCFNKSFASIDKSKYLHDKILDPLLISRTSHKKHDFDCDKCGHIFASPLNNITCLGRWCPYCAHQKLCDDDSCMYCFNNSFASHEHSKYWSDKNDMTPRQVVKNSRKLCTFVCNECCHEFSFKAGLFKNNKGCPFCAIPSQRVCDDINCTSCFKRSFASEEKSEFFSPKNNVDPRKLLKYSVKKYIFECKECNHEFESSLSNVVNGTWCPFCAKFSDALCDDQNCSYCYNKSFASVENSKYWSKKNITSPRDYTKNSSTKHWFYCPDCNHEFQKMIRDITRGRNWCSYCCIPTSHICDDENCLHCFHRSFASHENAKYWSTKNKLKPRNFIKNSLTKCWFVCQYCDFEYEAALHSVKGANSKCNLCINKSEKKMYEWLSSMYSNILLQKSFDWCIWKQKCYFDFVLKDKNIIIELDGDQHFIQVGSWGSPEKTQDRDIHKMQQALINGYSIIRVYQFDVFKDSNDWRNKLQQAIEMEYKVPQVIYISSDDRYNIYIEKMSELKIE
jgi:very-short-patch-repair endonuclease